MMALDLYLLIKQVRSTVRSAITSSQSIACGCPRCAAPYMKAKERLSQQTGKDDQPETWVAS